MQSLDSYKNFGSIVTNRLEFNLKTEMLCNIYTVARKWMANRVQINACFHNSLWVHLVKRSVDANSGAQSGHPFVLLDPLEDARQHCRYQVGRAGRDNGANLNGADVGRETH